MKRLAEATGHFRMAVGEHSISVEGVPGGMLEGMEKQM